MKGVRSGSVSREGMKCVISEGCVTHKAVY